nr:immunoglobulin heavy chain junction region [Macaca mulatta]MOY27993.1 immunoglobulin heavy chain junction region [Macaca mulatta]
CARQTLPTVTRDHW